ncbi:MAG: CHC2 zinc finger domain-containing protein, partial [Phycisphaerales bacterium JB064]
GGAGGGGRPRIPRAAIDQVLDSVSIHAIVGQRVPLKGSGNERMGVCPFHDDKSPSMGVNAAKGIFKCFACGVGGDAIDFVSKYDGVEWLDALREVAQAGGVDVPELHGRTVAELSPEKRAELERTRAEAAKRAAEREKAAEAERLEDEAAARDLFCQCEPDDGSGVAAQYLMGRGIDTSAAWFAGFCADVRQASTLGEKWRDDETGEWRSSEGPGMVALLRDAEGTPVGVQRYHLEASDRGIVKRSTARDVKKTKGTAMGAAVRLFEGDVLEHGRLILAEGIETATAIMAATHGSPAWAVLSTTGLKTFELPRELRGKLHSVVIAADCDKSEAGWKAALRCADRIREQSPATVVRIAMPDGEDAPGLFDERGPKGKGVDWLDVSVSAGAEVVARAMDGALEVRFDDEGSSDEDAGAVGHGGSDAAGGSGGRGVPMGAGGGGDDGGRQFRHDDHAAFARGVLEDMYAPPEDDRVASRWLIAWYGDRWFRRLPGESRWREDDEKRVHAQVWQQLREYEVAKRGKWKPLAPTAQTVRGVMEAMIAECGVFAGQLPAWAPATFDAKGRPAWGRSAHVYDDVAGTIDPRSAVATRSGILDADAWAEGELRVEPLSPLWFSTGTLPHELPLDAMRDAIDEEACLEGVEGVELCAQMCPTWLEFLRDITEPYAGGGAELGDDEKWIMGLQEWFGYLLTYDTRYETIGLMTGPTRSGKGTVQTALRSILGPGQIASSTFQELASRWKPLELVDKPVCIMPDASIGRFTDAIACAERLKNIRGGDPLSIEKHGHGFVGAVVLPTRMMIFVNELPKLPDSAGALAGSMVNWPTAKSFEGKEDRTLKARITAEGAGIMVWALFGLRRLRKRGVFTRCQAGEAVLEELRAMGAPVYHFVNEECFRGKGHGVECQLLWQAYQKWAEEGGHTGMNQSTFGVKLKAAFPGIARERKTMGDSKTRKWVYMGVRPATVGDEGERIVWPVSDGSEPTPMGTVGRDQTALLP